MGGKIAGRVARAVSTGSTHVVSYGLLSGLMIDPRGLPYRIEVSNLHLRGVIHDASRSEVLRPFARSFEGIRAGVIATDIAAAYPLTDIGRALAWNAANSGKTLIRAPGMATGDELDYTQRMRPSATCRSSAKRWS